MSVSRPRYRQNTLETWNTAVEDALEYRRRYGREAMWAQVEALFYHAHQMQDHNVGPNILASTGDALLSSLCVPNPFYLVKALRMDNLDACPVLESVLNMFIGALGLKPTAELCALHAFLFGRGIAKIGFDSEFGYTPQTDMGFEHNTILGMSLSQFDKKGQKIEYNHLVEPGMPWVESVLPHDFILPWGVRDINAAPWCGHRIIRHIDDIRADPKYENKRDLVPQLSMADWVRSYMTVMKPYRMGERFTSGKREDSDKAEFVEMWEIHDTRTGRVMVFSPGYDEFLRNDIDYLQEDGLPFVSLGFVPGARTFWTTPDSIYLQSPQEEAIDIAAIQRRQRRQSTLRFLYRRGSITKDELDKYLSGEIGICAAVEPGEGPLNETIVSITPQNANLSLMQEADAIRRDARETVGFGRNQMGEYEGTGRRTATEANVVSQKADLRLDRRQDLLSTFYGDIGKKLARIIFKFWKTPRVVQVIGPDGAAQWQTFTGSALRGEYQYKVGFSSEPVETAQARQQRAMTLFQNLSMDPTIDPLALRRMLVRAFNDPEFTSLFKPGVVSNAPLSNAMSQLQPPMGSPQQQVPGGGGSQQQAPMPQLPAA